MVLWDAPYPTLYQQSDVTLVSEPLLDGTVNKQNRSQMTVNRCSLILTLSLSAFAANLPILTHTRSGEIEISRNVSTAPAKMVPTQMLQYYSNIIPAIISPFVSGLRKKSCNVLSALAFQKYNTQNYNFFGGCVFVRELRFRESPCLYRSVQAERQTAFPAHNSQWRQSVCIFTIPLPLTVN